MARIEIDTTLIKFGDNGKPKYFENINKKSNTGTIINYNNSEEFQS